MVLVFYKLIDEYRTIQTTDATFFGLQSSDVSSTLVCVTSFPCEESRMITVEFITALFYEVDEQLGAIPKHPEAHLWPSEVVTLGLLHALKGGGNRAFYRWLTKDYRPLFPRLPERTRLFRLFTTHQDWKQAFLAAPTVLGGVDNYGIELIQLWMRLPAPNRQRLLWLLSQLLEHQLSAVAAQGEDSDESAPRY